MHTHATFAFRPASPKEKGQEREGNGTPAMAPAPSEEVTFVLALKSATRPKAKTEAQILAQWRNRAPVYTRHHAGGS